MTIDLFSPSSSDDMPALESSPLRAPAIENGERLLEQVMADSGRKSALKNLESNDRAVLAKAVAIVAGQKLAAYERARAGLPSDSMGWMGRNPALAQAIGVLHGALIDTNVIPMATVGADENSSNAEPSNET